MNNFPLRIDPVTGMTVKNEFECNLTRYLIPLKRHYEFLNNLQEELTELVKDLHFYKDFSYWASGSLEGNIVYMKEHHFVNNKKLNSNFSVIVLFIETDTNIIPLAIANNKSKIFKKGQRIILDFDDTKTWSFDLNDEIPF